ncbi:MAG: hypothetical protein ACRDL4_21250, partial [Thermoleophilaceae bacterium]
MSSLRRALWALAAAGVVMGLIVFELILTNDRLDVPGAWATGALVIGWGFVGVGLFAWSRRPENRTGMLMVATGFAWLVASIGYSDLPLLFTLGQVLGSLYLAVVMHLLLAFPTGKLQSRMEERLVQAGYVLTTAVVFPLWLFADPAELDCADCPDNVLLV